MKTTSLSWTQFLSTSSYEKNENSNNGILLQQNESFSSPKAIERVNKEKHENGQILFSSHENEHGEKKRSNRLASTF